MEKIVANVSDIIAPSSATIIIMIKWNRFRQLFFYCPVSYCLCISISCSSFHMCCPISFSTFFFRYHQQKCFVLNSKLKIKEFRFQFCMCRVWVSLRLHSVMRAILTFECFFFITSNFSTLASLIPCKSDNNDDNDDNGDDSDWQTNRPECNYFCVNIPFYHLYWDFIKATSSNTQRDNKTHVCQMDKRQRTT